MARTQAQVTLAALSVLSAQPNVSLAAKGLAAYILSCPPRVITRAELFRSTSDPMPFIDGAIRELEALGMVAVEGGGIILRVARAS